MNKIRQSSRVNTALQVVERTNEGMTVKDACLAVGLARSSFYYILAKNEKAIAELQEQIIGDIKVRLATLIGYRFQLLEKICQDAIAETTKPKDTIAILKYLDALFENLSQKLPNDNAIQNASEFLTGPKVSKQKSRMTAYSTAGGR